MTDALAAILKDKPPTPKCQDELSWGNLLVWTPRTGWIIKHVKAKEIK